MPDKVEVRDLSFLTLLALQDADCFRRRDVTKGQYLAAFHERLHDTFDLTGSGLKTLDPSMVLIFMRALRTATGVDYNGLDELASGLRKQLVAIREMVSKNVAGVAQDVSPDDLRSTMSFLRSLHRQLLVHKQREIAKRATRSVLRQRD